MGRENAFCTLVPSFQNPQKWFLLDFISDPNTWWCSKTLKFGKYVFNFKPLPCCLLLFVCFVNLVKCSTMILEFIGLHLNLKYNTFYEHGLAWSIFLNLLIKSLYVFVRKDTFCSWRIVVDVVFPSQFGKECLTKLYLSMTAEKIGLRTLEKYCIWIQKASSNKNVFTCVVPLRSSTIIVYRLDSTNFSNIMNDTMILLISFYYIISVFFIACISFFLKDYHYNVNCILYFIYFNFLYF